MNKRHRIEFLAISALCMMNLYVQQTIAQDEGKGTLKPIGPFSEVQKANDPLATDVSTPGADTKSNLGKSGGIHPSDNSSKDVKIKIFTLENSDATELARILKQLNSGSMIAVDPRTNCLIIESTSEVELRKFEEILQELDQRPTRANLQVTPVSPVEMEKPQEATDKMISRKLSKSLSGMQILNHPKIQALLEELSKKEVQAAALAEKIRMQLKEPPAEGVTGRESVRKELDVVLAEAIAVKFQLEQLQLAALEERVSRLKAQMGQRTASTRQIIERRARELIEGDSSRWNASESEVTSASTAKPADTAGIQSSSTRAVDDSIVRPNFDGTSALMSRRASAIDRSLHTSDLNVAEIASSGSLFPGYQDLAKKLSTMDRNVSRAEDTFNQMEKAAARGAILQQELLNAKHQFEDAILNRKLISQEYQGTMRELELQVEAAQAELNRLEAEWRRVSARKDGSGIVNKMIRETEEKLEPARYSLMRHKLRYELYRKAGEAADFFGQQKVPTQDTTESAPQSGPDESQRPNSASTPTQSSSFPINRESPAVVPDVPKDFAQQSTVDVDKCIKILRNSADLRELQVAIRMILAKRQGYASHGQNNPVLANQVVELAREVVLANARIVSKSQSPAVKAEFKAAWEQFEIPVKMTVLLKILKEGAPAEKLVAIRSVSSLWNLIGEPGWTPLCEELLRLEMVSDPELRVAVLKVLVDTLPFTTLESAALQSEERREMVTQLKRIIPRDRVINNLKTALGEKQISLSLPVANLVSESQARGNLIDEELVTPSIEVLRQIVNGQFQGNAVSLYQRRQALNGLIRFQSRSTEIVPQLIELLKADKSEFQVEIPERNDTFSRFQIVQALEAFGPEAKAALPFLEDELTLLKIKPVDRNSIPYDLIQLQNSKQRLQQAINRIRASSDPAPPGTPGQS